MIPCVCRRGAKSEPKVVTIGHFFFSHVRAIASSIMQPVWEPGREHPFVRSIVQRLIVFQTGTLTESARAAQLPNDVNACPLRASKQILSPTFSVIGLASHS